MKEKCMLPREAKTSPYAGPIKNILLDLDPNQDLPLFQCFESFSSSATTLSLRFLSHARPGVGKFFFEIVSRWLIPGRLLNPNLFFTADFQWNEVLYNVSEMILEIRSGDDLAMIRTNLVVIENELRLGSTSPYRAARILEVK